MLSDIIASGISYCWQDFSTYIFMFNFIYIIKSVYLFFGGGGVKNTVNQKFK